VVQRTWRPEAEFHSLGKLLPAAVIHFPFTSGLGEQIVPVETPNTEIKLIWKPACRKAAENEGGTMMMMTHRSSKKRNTRLTLVTDRTTFI
jgi:hypothetical protein